MNLLCRHLRLLRRLMLDRHIGRFLRLQSYRLRRFLYLFWLHRRLNRRNHRLLHQVMIQSFLVPTSLERLQAFYQQVPNTPLGLQHWTQGIKPSNLHQFLRFQSVNGSQPGHLHQTLSALELCRRHFNLQLCVDQSLRK